MNKKNIAFLLTLFVFCAPAFAATQINLAIGKSVPASEQNFVFKNGPSRASGGEKILLRLNSAKQIQSIRLTGFSASRSGKTLVHAAQAVSAGKKISLDGLTKFSAVTSGNPTNFDGKVMLTDSTFVEVTPAQSLTSLELTLEGYTNDDASILLQVSFQDEITLADFLITRSAQPLDSAGGLIDEVRFEKFTSNELQSLMSQGRVPLASELDGKTYVCTAYTKLNPTRLNYKTRKFMLASDGSLKSESDLEGSAQSWASQQKAVVRTISNQNACGAFTSYQGLRMTGSGNLVSEVVTELEAYVRLCVSAGFDEEGVRAVEANSTFPSRLSAQYVVDSYEYCRVR